MPFCGAVDVICAGSKGFSTLAMSPFDIPVPVSLTAITMPPPSSTVTATSIFPACGVNFIALERRLLSIWINALSSLRMAGVSGGTSADKI